jgi:hypothetical protein
LKFSLQHPIGLKKKALVRIKLIATSREKTHSCSHPTCIELPESQNVEVIGRSSAPRVAERFVRSLGCATATKSAAP